MPSEQLNDGQLTERLKIIFETWPLYREMEYVGGQSVNCVPLNISLYCDICEHETLWQTDLNSIAVNRVGFMSKEYTCRNCGGRTYRFYFFWKYQNGKGLFFKVGQYPEMEERIPNALEAALDKDDIRFYKNALRLRNFNLGIAAVAYMRRVVEDKMNDMLAILHETAVAHGVSADVLARHEAMMKEKRFDTKIDYAGDLLPANLRPGGLPNPMAILHQLASEGLHMKSDEECVEIFDACRKVFEYVFGRLRVETEDAKAFVKTMVTLGERRKTQK